MKHKEYKEDYTEEYIIENADDFVWNTFECDMNHYSKDFVDQFESEIPVCVWRNSKGEYHRVDGPALVYKSGDKRWCINGHLHRLDGPAIEDPDGNKEWYIDGKRLTKREFYVRRDS